MAHRTGVTRDREKAYTAVINEYIKSSPEHWDEVYRVIQQNKERKQGMKDDFGSTQAYPDDIRVGLSIPPGLFYFMQNYERMHDREFLQTKEDLRWFARKFPQFCIIRRI